MFWFFSRKTYILHFVKNSKNIRLGYKTNNLFLDMCLYVIFQKFGHFELKAISVSLSQKFLTKKCFFAIFYKSIMFRKNWYQKWILWLMSIPEMYTFIYITVIVWKLQHSICFKKFWVHTSLKVALL